MLLTTLPSSSSVDREILKNILETVANKLRTCMAMSRSERRVLEEKEEHLPDRLSLGLSTGPSDRPRSIDLSRARRRTHDTITHDTSCTTRHARHGTATPNFR